MAELGMAFNRAYSAAPVATIERTPHYRRHDPPPGRNPPYYGDNLPVLREQIEDGSIDLIYLVPPFNSNAAYNVLCRAPAGQRSEARPEAIKDSWRG